MCRFSAPFLCCDSTGRPMEDPSVGFADSSPDRGAPMPPLIGEVPRRGGGVTLIDRDRKSLSSGPFCVARKHRDEFEIDEKTFKFIRHTLKEQLFMQIEQKYKQSIDKRDK